MHTARNTIRWLLACAAVLAGGAWSCRSGSRPSSRPDDASVEPDAVPAGEAELVWDSAGRPRLVVAYSPSPWLEGSVSRLRSGLIEEPWYDGSYGATRFELEATDGSDRAPWRRDLEGRWTVLGYSPVRHAYVLGGRFQKGAWLPLDDLRYLEERTGSLLPSRLNSRRWIAFAAVPSPTVRYVALIARVDDQPQFRLHVLDIDNDEIAEAGPAPAPPPTDFNCDPPPRPHQWDDEVDGLVEMDAGIIVFSADERRLTASYGDDTCAARSAQRTTREWDLERDLPWPASANVAAAADVPAPGKVQAAAGPQGRILIRRGGWITLHDIEFATTTVVSSTAPRGSREVHLDPTGELWTEGAEGLFRGGPDDWILVGTPEGVELDELMVTAHWVLLFGGAPWAMARRDEARAARDFHTFGQPEYEPYGGFLLVESRPTGLTLLAVEVNTCGSGDWLESQSRYVLRPGQEAVLEPWSEEDEFRGWWTSAENGWLYAAASGGLVGYHEGKIHTLAANDEPGSERLEQRLADRAVSGNNGLVAIHGGHLLRIDADRVAVLDPSPPPDLELLAVDGRGRVIGWRDGSLVRLAEGQGWEVVVPPSPASGWSE